MIELIVNGERIQVPESVRTVSELLAYFGLERKVVIVEINQTILEKAAHADTLVRSGDRIEMVHFVGGG
ncbi:sulfur carrier protein ThiS [Gordoniibacillus kamchatkensis]|uniref:sulfur carrier protein ThiS n=1 Tax=Gordoniibacillus kamchatkensis TaxID=1590651 RepID=UPI000A6E1004